MVKLLNLVKVNIATTGTGTVTFGPAFSTAFFTPSEAGAADGDSVSYVLVEGNDTEIGTGVIGSSATTMTRTVLKSKIGGVAGTTKMTLGGTAWLAFTALDRDILIPANNLSDVANAATARTNLSAASSGANSDITSLSGLTTPLSIAQGGTGDAGTAWTSSSPTVTASSGTFTSVSATLRSKTIGKMFYFKLTVTITTAGTAGGIMLVALPVTLSSGVQSAAVALSTGAVGAGTANTSTLSLFNSGGGSLIANGVSVFASGVLETN